MYTYSIVIPHHNAPLLLNRCLNSIPERNDVQIIVVDDNSEEDKRPRVERKDVELISIDSKNTKGAGKARNEGLKRATGKWLLFADCDDYYCDGFLSILDKYKDDKFDVLYFNFRQEDGSNEKTMPTLYFQEYFSKYDGTKESLDKLKYHHNVPWTKMVDREFVERNDIKFEEAINGNDILFSISVGYFAKDIKVEKAPVYVYLNNANSITHKKVTVDSAYCRFVHNIKINRVYRFVGHPEWTSPFFKYLFRTAGSLRNMHCFEFLVKISINSIHLFLDRDEWVRKFNQ